MPPKYLALARDRAEMTWPNYKQPENFGYDFREWVSPYTKSAHALGGIAFVLQDWASAKGLEGGPKDEVQKYGRTPTLLTNKRFDKLLQVVLGLNVTEVYVTNAFPFVKLGGMSDPISSADVSASVLRFAQKELEIVQPKFVFSLGAVAHASLSKCGIESIKLPHPAARIGGFLKHEAAWREAMANLKIRTVKSIPA